MAQKLATMPSIPVMLRAKWLPRQPLWMRKPCPSRARITNAAIAATRFRKKIFCIVGMFPASRTKSDISEKQNAAHKMHRMPSVRSLFCRGLFNGIHSSFFIKLLYTPCQGAKRG